MMPVRHLLEGAQIRAGSPHEFVQRPSVPVRDSLRKAVLCLPSVPHPLWVHPAR